MSNKRSDRPQTIPPDFTSTQQFEALGSKAPFIPPPPPIPRGWETLPLFAGMSHDARQKFAQAFDKVDYAKGDLVIKQGDTGDDMYVLDKGMVRVIVRNAEDVVVFERTFPAPAIFGEMALITKEPRSATLVAEEPSTCLRIDKASVRELFAREPGTAVFLTRLVGERLMEADGIRKVGKYEVDGRLGAGGVATVFEAKHPTLGIPVALKMLSHARVFDSTFADHFEEEARLVAKLQHENIVRVLDTEQAYGTHFIVMEKLVGQLLEELVSEGVTLTWQNVRRILRELAEALAYSHDHGFIHRDVKPENAFVLTDGRVKLMDFGIATHAGSGKPGEGKVIGTPYYMSPEQVCNEALDGRSDLYSLGVLAYELCTGDIPFDADSVQGLFAKHISEPMPDPRKVNPAVPPDLVHFIMKSTQKRRDDRFADCHEAAAYLRAASEIPVLDRFAMASLSVTYHESQSKQVDAILREATARLGALEGVVFFDAHHDPRSVKGASDEAS